MSPMASLVSDVMTRNVVCVREDAEYKDMVQVMRRRGVSAFPVLDAHDRVVGVLSEDDLLVKEGLLGAEVHGALRHRDRAKAAALTAGKLMSHPAITMGPDATVAEAARTMHTRHVKRLPVVTGDGKIVGIVSRIDLLGVYDRPDEEIGGEIAKKVVEGQFALDPLAFTVDVTRGVVTMSGPADTEAVAHSLLLAVRRVDGVVAVRDRLSYRRD
jgi:CBS-domain-containing membrane protein